MTDSPLERDCLFQLNVLIWASFPQPPGAPVTPVLHNAGYVLWAIEQPLNAGITELPILRASTLEIRPNPVPDVVLQCEAKGTYVLVECKPTSFGVESEWVRQVRGLIVAGGNVVSRLGLPSGLRGEVCYLVPADDAPVTDLTLEAVAREVDGAGLRNCPTGAIGLAVKADGVYLGLQAPPLCGCDMSRALIPEQRVVAVDAGQSPKPLYVIPWVPNAPDKTAVDALREKLRAQLLGWLGKASVPGEPLLPFDDLMNSVTRNLLQYWRNRQSLEGMVFLEIASIVHFLFDRDARVVVSKRSVKVSLKTEEDWKYLMERLRTTKLPKKLPDYIQLPLDVSQ